MSAIYPARIVEGTEPVVAELQSILGENVISVNGNLVVPLFPHYISDLTPAGDPYAERILATLQRNEHDVPLLGTLGCSYLKPSSEGLSNVRANATAADQNFIREELEYVNICLLRWGISKRPLDPSIHITVEPIALGKSNLLHAIFKKHAGLAVTLSAPLTVEAPCISTQSYAPLKQSA